MNVLFIYPVPPARFQILRFQQGLGSISAVLKQAGHRTHLLTLAGLDEGAIASAIQSFDPGLIAISLTSGFFEISCQVARHVAARFHLPVLLGGVHPTLRPEECIAAEGVFAVCIGEGEYPTLELCAALAAGRDPTQIENLWVRHKGKVWRNPIRPLIADLDTLPFAAREVFDYSGLLRQLPEAEFMGSRGCPFLCSYCVNHALIELYKGRGAYVRFRTVDHLLREVDDVLARYPETGFVGFHDDTFTLRPDWLEEFAAKYPRPHRLRFWCNATAPSLTERTVEWLRKAGCYEVRIGLESGNDNIRMNVLKKNVQRADIIRAFRLLHAAGINTYAFNMVGLPYETVDTIRDTIRLNHAVRPKVMFCSIFQPYPGTRLDDLCREQGWFSGKTVKSYFENNYALTQPTIAPREVVFFHDVFRELARCPWAEGIIRWMYYRRITKNKTLWNVFRRVRAKWNEFRARFSRPERKWYVSPKPA